ncbi:MAG TPA: AbrB/MazE/SpoVT family DNA-binding domain-containing protein [Geminicoccaceae bacterium]|nr:AbrB/MazE/SpoVT family DNA-binding domain-containing protein [Geminicoccaceae bacterium]
MRVSRWGNSLAVRIPRTVADQARIEEGQEVELTVTDGCLTIRPRARGYTLDELLEQVTPENRHDEVDWGKPEGGEVW